MFDEVKAYELFLSLKESFKKCNRSPVLVQDIYQVYEYDIN